MEFQAQESQRRIWRLGIRWVLGLGIGTSKPCHGSEELPDISKVRQKRLLQNRCCVRDTSTGRVIQQNVRSRARVVGVVHGAGGQGTDYRCAERRSASDRIMSKTSKRNPRSSRNELRAEYDFDYGNSRPNRCASQLGKNAVAVVLEPDVAQVFDSSDSVNQLLRSVISALPRRKPRVRAARRKAG